MPLDYSVNTFEFIFYADCLVDLLILLLVFSLARLPRTAVVRGIIPTFSCAAGSTISLLRSAVVSGDTQD